MHRTGVLCFLGSADGSRRTVVTDFFRTEKEKNEKRKTRGSNYDTPPSVPCSKNQEFFKI